MKKNKAFTLIELIAVLVILAIISLIVAPLILNTVRRVKNDTNKRSIDGYGRAAQYAISNYELKQLPYPDSFDELEIDYHGNKVECETSRINPDHTIYLSECKVNGRLVKNEKEFDGYYHYGILKMTNQEYIDTYGKNLEDALKKYHDEHNEYPSDYTTLELPPLDKEVSCDVDINYDGTVYLNDCKVDNEDVVDDNNEVYVYGKYVPSYVIGDEITYNGINFYVIEDSDTMKDYVTLLKAEPLTVDEVNLYGGVGTDNNHVNMYTTSNTSSSHYQKAYNRKGYGALAFYSSDSCGNVNETTIVTGCNNDYNNSDIKFVVDAWASAKILESDIKIVDDYKARLIYSNEIKSISDLYSWKYNNDYMYWTMTKSTYGSNKSLIVEVVTHNGINNNIGKVYNYKYVYADYSFVIRPVVNLKKSALE